MSQADGGPRYAAFLRGVNMIGRRTVKMGDLRRIFEVSGFSSVTTILASGNAVFESNRSDPATLRRVIGAALERRLGYPVGVIVRGLDDLQALADADPFRGVARTPGTKLLITLLNEAPARGLPDAVHISRPRLHSRPRRRPGRRQRREAGREQAKQRNHELPQTRARAGTDDAHLEHNLEGARRTVARRSRTDAKPADRPTTHGRAGRRPGRRGGVTLGADTRSFGTGALQVDRIFATGSAAACEAGTSPQAVRRPRSSPMPDRDACLRLADD
jgi:hypothetical protein